MPFIDNVGAVRTIFVVDDDGDFVGLLSEILSQAGYEVFSNTQPTVALKVLQERTFDLLVIDQRMGDMSGCEMLEKIRAAGNVIPTIVISAFLEHSSAQQFISLGVSGIFFKPLNIFALLKRVEEIFKGAVTPSGNVGSAITEPGIRGFTSMPFGVNKDVFLKKVQQLAGFKGNLLLVGEAESPFEKIVEEMMKKSDKKDQLLLWDARLLSATTLEAAAEGSTALTFLIKSLQILSEKERKAIASMSKREAPYQNLPPVRFIFCSEEDLDSLYEKKLIDDEFYLFLGNLELKIPKAAAVQNAARNLPPVSASASPFKSGRVLVLDDEDLHAQMVVDLLEEAGLRTLKLNSPAEALAVVKKERFALIITDFRMPGINGVDFVTQARQTDPTIPIFIVTGNIDLPEMVRIGNMGVTRIIEKPINNQKFIDEVLAVART